MKQERTKRIIMIGFGWSLPAGSSSHSPILQYSDTHPRDPLSTS